MIQTKFRSLSMPLLGFGTMRLPVTADKEIDRDAFFAMVDYAMAHGVNYFDTAYPYHGGKSEILTGEALSRYPRESYYLATKYPGHQVVEKYDPAAIFEEQLQKCGVDYFDFYLLHNVYENSMDVYLDERRGILDYFREQKRLGRILHLGFSTHAKNDTLVRFLDAVGEDMEFCQIQLNWMDWTLQDAKEKVRILNERQIPIWVMEPLRGGKLCKLSDADEKTLRDLRPDEKIPAWAFRFLENIPGVTVILSGMSNMEQIQANIATLEHSKPLTDTECGSLLSIAEGMKDTVPCTTCGYCMAGCPMGLDIPKLIATANDLRFAPITNTAMWLEGVPAEKHPTSCISCGKCIKICPQNINIPAVLSELSSTLERVPKWLDICREREALAKKLRGEG